MIGAEDRKRLCSWFVLKGVPGAGNLACKRLIDCFGSPDAVLHAKKSELAAIEGISLRVVSGILKARVHDDILQEIDSAAEKGFTIITYTDRNYPTLLREIADPPPFLYVSGQLPTDFFPLAIVGTRNPTRYGITMARRLAADLTKMGITIVSGMARGIDSAAHGGALSAEGKTIAVLGSGLSVVYPPENRGLYGDISKSGAVLSEFPITEEPNSYNFPARNRIISGMSMGVVVVEAAVRSGSLITARLAAEQGREVFAVPGNINSFKSAGTHLLLKQGAKLVERAGDIMEELGQFLPSGFSVSSAKDHGRDHRQESGDTSALNESEQKVLAALDPYPIQIDELGRKLSMDTAGLSALLFDLELKGLAVQTPGKYFSSSGDKA
ncbi:MAG: DNA-protecting protein DprA [Deltaproteobacteria bacterium]|nr:DNA-protecting protein DprA [Deltaproteobacteria bacterium]